MLCCFDCVLGKRFALFRLRLKPATADFGLPAEALAEVGGIQFKRETKMKKGKRTVNDELGFGEFETTHGGGFAPSWKPKNAGEFILLTPTNQIKQLPKMKGVKKPGFVMQCVYLGGNSDNFYRGSGKKSEQVSVDSGEMIALMLSHNLYGDDTLAIEDDGEVRLSRLSEFALANAKPLKILFEGKVSIAGGRSVNQFITQAPKGLKLEAFSQKDGISKKWSKRDKK